MIFLNPESNKIKTTTLVKKGLLPKKIEQMTKFVKYVSLGYTGIYSGIILQDNTTNCYVVHPNLGTDKDSNSLLHNITFNG